MIYIILLTGGWLQQQGSLEDDLEEVLDPTWIVEPDMMICIILLTGGWLVATEKPGERS